MKGIQFLLSLKERVEKPLASIKAKFEGLKKIADKVKNIIIKPRVNNEELDRLNDRFGGLKRTIAGVFAVGAITAFGHNVISTLGEFEKYEAVLTNTFGDNSKAKQSLEMITDFAAKTPFSVSELSDSFVKLANRGFVPVQEQMRKLGDLASSVGKPFDQLTEAILDAQTGEFERLKEFGIKANKAGDQITFAFKGQAKTVKFSESAIRDYILSLGDLNGVSGAMAAISQTTEGQISNLGDTMDSLYLTIGKELKPEISAVISALSTFVGIIKDGVLWISRNREMIGQLAVVIGIAAAAWGVYQLVVNGATLAQWALNIALSANPIALIIIGIAALVSAIVILWNKSEKFRGFMIGLWETMKQVFKNIWEGAKKYLGGLGDLLVGIATLDLEKIKAGSKAMFEGGLQATMPIQGTADAFNKGYTEGVEQVREKERQNGANPETDKSLVPGPGKTSKQELANKRSSVEQGLNSVVGDAKQSRNITVNIGTLKAADKIETKSFQKQDTNDIEKDLKELLMRMIRNFEATV